MVGVICLYFPLLSYPLWPPNCTGFSALTGNPLHSLIFFDFALNEFWELRSFWEKTLSLALKISTPPCKCNCIQRHKQRKDDKVPLGAKILWGRSLQRAGWDNSCCKRMMLGAIHFLCTGCIIQPRQAQLKEHKAIFTSSKPSQACSLPSLILLVLNFPLALSLIHSINKHSLRTSNSKGRLHLHRA